jgi:hypothetical protein
LAQGWTQETSLLVTALLRLPRILTFLHNINMLATWNRINSAAAKADGNGATSEKYELVIVYAVFASIAVLVHQWIGEGEFSAILTLSAVGQCLAFCLLGVHALSTGSVKGISGKSLQLEAMAVICRLATTLWFQGYIPTDDTGDGMYQCIDAVSLVLVLGLLYRVLTVPDRTYEAEADSLPVLPLAAGALVLACLLHGEIMQYRAFDILWMCGLFIGAVSVVPQLWLMTHRKESTPALTSHFIAVMALSRILASTYMWYAHTEIDCRPWIGEFKHAGWATMGAQVVHLLLLADFAYFYVKNLVTSGLRAPLDLPNAYEYV